MKNKHVLLIIAVLLASLGCASARNVTVNWDASSSPQTVGYNVYYGTTSGNYTSKITVSNVTTATISNLDSNVTYYFSATAVDANGNESAFANETSFIVPGGLTLSKGANPGDPMTLQFAVESGHWYEIQATTDFKNWTTISTTEVETDNTMITFADPDAANYSSRFYRLGTH